MFSHVFIDRPIFATVLSIVIVIVGTVALTQLPIAQYPEVAPPTITVTANYPGANAKVVADTVATPIEQEVNGVENMIYMSSRCTNDGQMLLDVTFKLGTNLDMAQVLVQNRVKIAEAKLPEEVKRQGVTTKKKSPSILLCVNLISEKETDPETKQSRFKFDQLYLSNYATIYIKDELARIPGVGDVGFLGPRDEVAVVSEDYGIDLEAEVVVITDDVPMAVTPAAAAGHIQLIGLINDVSLRNLIPDELAKGFGFLQSKPRSALSPVFVTPDELGEAWSDSKVHLPLLTHINGAWFGAPEAGVDMQFNFAQLIAHAAKTRPLSAGTIVGSGTIANQDTAKGASCLAERRTLEVIASGKPSTSFLRFGDVVRIEMFDRGGHSIFGAIDQKIAVYRR